MRYGSPSPRASIRATARSRTRSRCATGSAPNASSSVLLSELARGAPRACGAALEDERRMTAAQDRLRVLLADRDHGVGRELERVAVRDEAVDAGVEEHRSRLVADELAQAGELEEAA